MHADNIHADANSHSLDDSSSKFQLTAKLIDKLERLAQWRLSPSSIKFPKGGSEFRGGYATVSRAFLTSPPNSQNEVGEFYDKRDEVVGSDGRSFNSEDAVEEYEQEASEHQKVVAVKMMRIQGDLGRVLGLTLREAEFLVELAHENIIPLEGFVEDVSKDIIWLVLPWAENGTLKAFIASHDWEIPERISLIDDVAKAVAYLHSREPPICHGDLKSINVLVNSECRGIITDFGSARRVVAEGSDQDREQTSKKLQETPSLEATFCASTNTITLTGNQYTLRWAAPELLQEDQSSLRSDIWALGWVAYEVMTNFIPFQDVKDIVVITRIVRGDLPTITQEARMLMIQALYSLMAKCWSIDPTKRPTAEDCRRLISWMPMVIPNSSREADAAARSPQLLLQLGTMYEQQDDYLNASKLIEEALGVYAEIDDQEGKAEALWRLAQIQLVQNKGSQAISLYKEALQIYTDVGNHQGRADALMGLAEVHRSRNEYSQALSLYSEVLQIRTEIGDRNGRANTLFCLAEVHRGRSEYDQAVPFYSEAFEILTELGDKQGRAFALHGLASVYRVRSEYNQALTCYSQALEDYADIGDRRGRAFTLWAVAEVHRVRNEYDKAIAYFSEVLDTLTDIGDSRGRALALGGLADLHRVRNECDDATALYSEALDILTSIGDRQGRAYILWGLAEIHRIQKEYDKAVPLYSEALEIQTDVGDKQGRASTLRGLADLHRLRDEYNQAVTLYHESVEIHTDIGDLRGRAEALEGLADIHRLRHEYGKAIALHHEILKISTETEDGCRKACALSGLANVYRDQGDDGNALHHYGKASELFEQIGHAKDAAYASAQAADLRQRLEHREAA